MRKIICCVLTAAVLIFCIGCGSQEEGFDTFREISVNTRENGSGTRGAFIELFGVEQRNEAGEKVDYTTQEAAVNNNTAVMMTAVSGNPYAIGYISLGSLDSSVKAVQIDGAAATVDNIKNGSYAASRPFIIAVKGQLSPAAQDFVNYMMSQEGQAVIEEKGYISVASAEAFAGTQPSGKIVVAGSSSVTPVMEKLKEAYLAVNTKVQIEIQESDSTSGMNAVMDGTCDIGMASRTLKSSEIEAGLKGTTIAMDGIAVIVNTENPTENLTSEQVKNIYLGELTAWSEIAE